VCFTLLNVVWTSILSLLPLPAVIYLCIYFPPLLSAWLNGAYQGFIIFFLKKDLLMITTLTPQKPPIHSLNPDQRLNGPKKNLNMGANTVYPPLKNPKKFEKKKGREAHIGHPGPIIPRIPPYTHGFTTETQSFLRDCGDGCQASLRLHVAACGQRRCA
jgi:hypothetical protein